MTNEREKKTVRERIRRELGAAGGGLSRSALTRRVRANPGVVRAVLRSMADQGEIEVEKVETDHGAAVLHTLAELAEEEGDAPS